MREFVEHCFGAGETEEEPGEPGAPDFGVHNAAGTKQGEGEGVGRRSDGLVAVGPRSGMYSTSSSEAP